MDMQRTFTCERCGYSTPRKALLAKHLRRLQECPPVFTDAPASSLLACIVKTHATDASVATTCECGKVLKNSNSLRYHKTHHCASARSSQGPAANTVLPGLHVDHEEWSKLKQQIEELLLWSQSDKTVATTNNILQHNVTNNIVINAFGNESTDHITTQFLDQCVRRTDKGLIELIGKLHFDPDHQENCNMKITNMKTPIMKVHNGITWRYDKKNKILNELVDKGHGMMQDHFDDNEERLKDQVSEAMFDHIRKWMDKMQDRDKKVLEGLLTDIYILILNANAGAEL